MLSGASCSGKTTLAPHLVRALRLPLVAKDDIKETLYDALGVPATRDDSRRLGRAAMLLLYAAAGRLVEAGVGAIVESNFWRGLCESELREISRGATIARVHCQAGRAVLVRRQLDRALGDAPRHAGHVAHLPTEPLRAMLADPAALNATVWPDEEPPDLHGPLLRVDTADGYQPSVERIIAWVEDALADPTQPLER